MDCSLPGTPSMEFSKQEYCSGEQGIFPTQDLKAGLQHCRQILYHLSHQGSCIHIFNYFFKSLRADLNKHFLSKLLTKYFNILKVCVHDPFGQLSNWLVSDQYQLYVWTLTRMITEARAQTLNLGCTLELPGSFQNDQALSHTNDMRLLAGGAQASALLKARLWLQYLAKGESPWG